MEPPSTRPWLGVGAALTALPAAGGCFCAALLLAALAHSDPGAVYEQHRWLGVVVAAGAVCAFVAMMGWATLRHGGVPVPVLLMALVAAGVPFAVPGGWFGPAALAALAACAALAAVGLARPPARPRDVRRLSGGLAVAACALAAGQAVAVGLHGPVATPRADVRSSSTSLPHVVPAEPAATAKPGHARRRPARASSGGAGRAGGVVPIAADAPAAAPPAAAPPAVAPAPSNGALREADAPAVAPPAAAPPAAAPAPSNGALGEVTPPSAAPPAVAPPAATPPAAAPPAASPATFIRAYYAALDARRFGAAWRMLAPPVQRAFGGFDLWRRGYARTVASSPEAVRISQAGGGATVGLTLRAGDRGADGVTVVRRFAVTWRLARTEAGWRATAAYARPL